MSTLIAVPINGQTWIVCGGRKFSDRLMFDAAMAEIIQLQGCPARIVQGGAGGADRFAWDWATRMAIECVEVYADWDTHGKAAGPIRNQKMLNYAPKAVIAFPGGKGTADMVPERARKAGIDVIEVQPTGVSPAPAPADALGAMIALHQQGWLMYRRDIKQPVLFRSAIPSCRRR